MHLKLAETCDESRAGHHPRCRAAGTPPSSQVQCSSLGPRWSSSWVFLSPPPTKQNHNVCEQHSRIKVGAFGRTCHYLCYLIYTTQWGLFRACDQMCPNTDHIDRVLLKASDTDLGGRAGKTVREIILHVDGYLPVELNHALLWDVIGPNNDKWVKRRNGEAVDIRQTEQNECPATEMKTKASLFALTAHCSVWRWHGLWPTGCTGLRCPDEPQQACSPVHTAPKPQHRSSGGRYWNQIHTHQMREMFNMSLIMLTATSNTWW